MPTSDALARETKVLELVCAELCSDERHVSIHARPDGDTSGEWSITTDAVLDVRLGNEQRLWAADVCTVGFHPQVPTAVRGLSTRLTDALTPLADRFGRAILVTRNARVRSDDTNRREFTAELETEATYIATCAERALKAGPDFYPFPDGNGAMRVLDQPLFPDGTPVHIGAWLSASADIAEQLERDLAPAIRKKLRGQFRSARCQGMPTLLILDQVGAPDLAIGANFLATAFSITPVVQACMDQQSPPTLDAVVLVDPYNAVQEIIGAVGTAVLDQP